MINRFLIILFITAFILMIAGCQRDIDLLDPAPNPSFSEVFIDGFVAGLDYSAFSNSKLDAFDVDNEVYFKGTSSIRITIPGRDDPSGWFAGGVFYSKFPRDLSAYDALTFWGKADRTIASEIGFGNDNTGNSLYTVMQSNVVFGTSWKKYIIPIPLASKLTAETGMLQYSAGADANGYGGNIWIDEVQYEKLGTIAYPRPVITDTLIVGEVGDLLDAGVTGVTLNVNGADQTLSAAPAYFTFISSDESVARATADGKISAIGIGTAQITVKLGSAEASQKITVNVVESAPRPSTPAPTPTVSADSVISLFSNAYTNVIVDTWNPFWQYSTAEVEDFQLDGDDMKLYTKLNFVGIEFTSQTVDASSMTHFHIDFWTPDPSAGAEFSVKLVDFGADGVFGGGNDSEVEIAVTSPKLVSQAWVSVDLPLSGLAGKAHVAQLILVGNDILNTVYVDNAYFYNDGGSGNGTGSVPEEAAPAPTQAAENVISLFSDEYSDANIDTWSAEWDNADLTETEVNGDNVKLYTNLVFAGIEFTSQTIDASSMEYFHMDIWTPDATSSPAVFKIKLVDFGADGAFDGGDDVEHELTLDAMTSPAIASESWVGLDIPLSDFTGLTTKGHLAQLIISGDLGTVYLDNIYFYKSGGGTATEPTEAAPAPTRDAADVISLFSDTYTNITVDTWRTDWSAATFEDVTVNGNATKKYSALDFVGIETVSGTVDASSMSHFHLDVWSADFTFFGIKLVDFGADGAFGGGDDVEHQINFETPQQGEWISYDIPLGDFAGLTSQGHIAQYILVGQPTGTNTIWVDNIYFYKSGGGTGTEPSEAAPTPSFAAGDVISLFSNAYSNVTVDTWSAEWDQADVADVQVASDAVKLYTSLVFAGIEFTSSTIDASSMTHFYMDVWTPDAVISPAVFKVKLVDFGSNGVWDGGGDDVEHELSFNNLSTPAMATGSWVTLDIPLTDFVNMTTRGHVAQLIISGDPNTVYVDNILFHK